ncbi:MAG: DUF1214 domain-containing protein [Rhodocyclaceae bacterium]|jgi:hypothetical protein|nr:DUF1214 domain-containing protein [Rhodocyclaceae bacterium]
MATNADTQLAQAWDQFCENLKPAKDIIFRESTPATEKDRAAGLRYVARNIQMALDKEFENADPLHPQLTHIMDWRRKQGGDNPDGLYLTAPINGTDTYRLAGSRGSARYFAITVTESGNSPWGGKAIATILDTTINLEADGSFEVIVSPEPPATPTKNWMKSTPTTHRLYIRQFFYDWEAEVPMDVRVERLGEAAPAPDFSTESVTNGLLNAAQWLQDITVYWTKCLEMWKKRPLEFCSFNQMVNNTLDATPGGEPLLCYWHMEADEALIIRVKIPPQVHFWNCEIGNWWFETMDYRYRLAGTNGHYARLEADDEAILVVSHDDPGVPNWLDASGYAAGYMCWRWIGTDIGPLPRIERVKRAELFQHLPPSIQRIGQAERQEQLAGRNRGITRRFAGF